MLHISPSGINKQKKLIPELGFVPDNLSFSMDGKKLFFACGQPSNYKIVLYNFDNSTGNISKPVIIFGTAPNNVDVHAAFFSPDGTKFYIGESNSITLITSLYQYDLSIYDSAAITASRYTVKDGSGYNTRFEPPIIGPDGKIYFYDYDEFKKKSYYSIIHHPNEKGAACRYQRFVFENKATRAYMPPYFLTRKPWLAPFQVEGHCQNTPVYINPWKTLKSKTYRWYFGDGDSTHERTPAPHIYKLPGTYIIKLIADDPYGKIDTYCYSHCIIPMPKHVLPKDTFICSDGNLILDAGNAGANYLWSDGDTARYKTVKQNQTLWLQTYFEDCAINDTINIAFIRDTIIKIGKDTAFCGEYSFTIHSGFALTKWSTGETGESITVNKTGTYIAMLKNTLCTVYDTIKVDFTHIPEIDFGSDTTICEGSAITLSAGDNNYNYLWSNGNKTNSITIAGSGTYWVTKNLGDCYITDSIHINIAPLPKVNLGNDTAICYLENGKAITLNAGTGIFSDKYIWNTGETTPQINIQEAGTYSVIVTNKNACSSTDSILINNGCTYTFYMPNAFSPDNNGLNETFKPEGTRIMQYNLLIYNRWGECIFQSSNINQGWDGKFKNVNSPEGIYYYQLQYKGDEKGKERMEYKNGVLHLIR